MQNHDSGTSFPWTVFNSAHSQEALLIFETEESLSLFFMDTPNGMPLKKRKKAAPISACTYKTFHTQTRLWNIWSNILLRKFWIMKFTCVTVLNDSMHTTEYKWQSASPNILTRQCRQCYTHTHVVHLLRCNGTVRCSDDLRTVARWQLNAHGVGQ